MLAAVLLLAGGGIAYSDPSDVALDAIASQIAGKDAGGAVSALVQLSGLSLDQQVRAGYYRAEADQLLGKTADATAVLEGLLALPKTNQLVPQIPGGAYGEQALGLLGQLYGAAKQFDKQVKLYEEMAKDYPNNAEWAYQLGEALLSDGRYDDATNQLGQYFKDHPNDAHAEDAAFDRAESLRRARRFQDEYDYVLTLPIGNGPSWEIRAGVLRAELLALYVRHDESLSNQICQDLLTKYPNDPETYRIYYRIARNYLYDFDSKDRDLKKAQTDLETLILKFPTAPILPTAQLYIAHIRYQLEDYSGAIDRYRNLLIGQPDDTPSGHLHPLLLYSIAHCYSALHDVVNTRSTLQTLMRLYPDDPWARDLHLFFSTDEIGVMPLNRLAPKQPPTSPNHPRRSPSAR